MGRQEWVEQSMAEQGEPQEPVGQAEDPGGSVTAPAASPAAPAGWSPPSEGRGSALPTLSSLDGVREAHHAASSGNTLSWGLLGEKGGNHHAAFCLYDLIPDYSIIRRPRISAITQDSSFCDGLISLGVISSQFIHELKGGPHGSGVFR